VVNFKFKNQIIFTLFAVLFVFCSNSYAEIIYKNVVLSWQPSISSDVVGYKLYKGTSENGPFELVPDIKPVLDSKTGRIKCVVPGVICGTYFVSTAYTSVGIESGISKVILSNEQSKLTRVTGLKIIK